MATNLSQWVHKFHLPINSVVHVGSHLAQERDEYVQLAAKNVLWVEAIPWVANQARHILRDYPNQKIESALLWSESGQKREFYVAGNEGSSSSTLKPYLISASHPEVSVSRTIVLQTETLDEVIARHDLNLSVGNLLVLDTQGAEIHILRGATNVLSHFDFIVAEVSTKELYESATEFKMFNSELKAMGFELIEAEINRVTGWGDALYARTSYAQSLKLESMILYTGRRFGARTFLRSLHLRAKKLFI